MSTKDLDLLAAEAELDALLDVDSDLEFRFRELAGGGFDSGFRQAQDTRRSTARQPPPQSPPPTDDPLAALKRAVEGREAERYVLLLCPSCQGKNRTSLGRLRTHLPRCGRCKAELAFTR